MGWEPRRAAPTFQPVIRVIEPRPTAWSDPDGKGAHTLRPSPLILCSFDPLILCSSVPLIL